MTEFTPGPWRIYKGSNIVAGDDNKPVALVEGLPITPNARLIAAAPTLYSACESILEAVGTEQANINKKVLKEVRDAVAQATAGRPETKWPPEP